MDQSRQAIFRQSRFLCCQYTFGLSFDVSSQDLWTHTDNGTSVREIYLHQVPAHGVVALLLKDAGNEPDGIWPPCQQIEWCMDQNGTRIDQ